MRRQGPDPTACTGEEPSIFTGDHAFGIELGRLERAVALQAFPLGDRRYEITGGGEPHFVDLAEDASWPCDCGDFAWRGSPGGPCKHLLRARLAEGDPRVILALAALLSATREYAASLERRLRPPPIRLTRALRERVALATGLPASAFAFIRAKADHGCRVQVLVRATRQEAGTLVRQGDGVEFIPSTDTRGLAA